MVFALTWLPEALELAGLKVAEVEGWRSRGRAEMGRLRGVMCHHTATPGHLDKNMPTLDLLVHGRPDLRGPLAQLGLGRDGTYYVIAAGRANHAGVGRWEGVTTGNSSFIGIEAEHSGRADDPWPTVQIEAYQRGAAAILASIDAEFIMCCGHKEYALPPGRKPDPDFDMHEFRKAVAALLQGKSPPPPIPARDDEQRPTLRRGHRGDGVRVLQRLLKAKADGIFGSATEAALRAFQRAAAVEPKLVPDGIAGPKTWAALDPAGKERVPLAASAAPTPTGTAKEQGFQLKAPAIMQALIDTFGFSPTQAAGILGNIGHECDAFTAMQERNPVGGGRGGYGWCQWTGPRRVDFEKYLEKNGLDKDSDEANLGFLVHELKTSEKRTVPALKKAATLTNAVTVFLEKFERAGISHTESRIRYAKLALEAFG